MICGPDEIGLGAKTDGIMELPDDAEVGMAGADYFNITLDGESSPVTFSSSTTVTDYNFYGVFHYVRFSWDNDSGNTGVIDKILYRR